jgi:hypothetical protein
MKKLRNQTTNSDCQFLPPLSQKCPMVVATGAQRIENRRERSRYFIGDLV